MAKSDLMTDAELDAMKMAMLREHRDSILRNTDPGICEGGWGSADRPYSEAMLTYRQALRDFPSTVTADDISHTDVAEKTIEKYFDTFNEHIEDDYQGNALQEAYNTAPQKQEEHVGIDVISLSWPVAPSEVNETIDSCMDQSKILYAEPPKPGLKDSDIQGKEDTMMQWQGEAWKPENRKTYTKAQLEEKYKDYDAVGVYANGDIATTKIK